jgi:four helix bundle protein
MTTFRTFEDIEAWQAARVLNRRIFQLSAKQTFGRDFALRDQIRRASLSVMANIAEGFERDANREFAHFLRIAKGSAGEVRALLYAALDQEHIKAEEFEVLAMECRSISRRIQGLIEYLQQSDLRGLKFKPSVTHSDKIRETAIDSVIGVDADDPDQLPPNATFSVLEPET